MDKKEWKKQIPDFIRRLILSWLLAAAAAYLQLSETERMLDSLEGLRNMSLPWVLVAAAVIFCGLCLLDSHTGIDIVRLERWSMGIVFLVLSGAAFKASFLDSGEIFSETAIFSNPKAIAFFIAVVLISSIFVVYAVYGWNNTPYGKPSDEKKFRRKLHADPFSSKKDWETKKDRAAAGIVGGFAALFFGFVSIWLVCRVLTYSSPSFDFGIFSQMFHQMKTTGVPVTTLERDGLLSHFAVHVSPVYYLLLPFYCLYPKPVTLQILQAGVLALAVIPAWKLTRRHGCSRTVSVLLCLILLLYPAFSGGASYDLHENVFLTLFLLWLFYAIDCRNGWQTAVFGMLTLMVKEDAAVYVAVIALWLLLSSLLNEDGNRCWGVAVGTLLFMAAVAWFLLVTGYLEKYGDGVMTYRYSNFMYEESSSLLTVIKAAILSPVKVIYECTDQEKICFLAQTMLPLCGIPIITRRYERFLLLIPYVLVNLMSDYTYQHDIFFQYTYGSTACLFYLTVVNYQDMAFRVRSSVLKYMPLILSAVLSGGLFAAVVVPKAISYPVRYITYRSGYSDIGDLLQLIPPDASVSATTFYTVPLSNREVLYDVRHSSQEHVLSTEYVVLEVHNEGSYADYAVSGENGYEQFTALLEENGYVQIGKMDDTLVIYWKES